VCVLCDTLRPYDIGAPCGWTGNCIVRYVSTRWQEPRRVTVRSIVQDILFWNKSIWYVTSAWSVFIGFRVLPLYRKEEIPRVHNYPPKLLWTTTFEWVSHWVLFLGPAYHSVRTGTWLDIQNSLCLQIVCNVCPCDEYLTYLLIVQAHYFLASAKYLRQQWGTQNSTESITNVRCWPIGRWDELFFMEIATDCTWKSAIWLVFVLERD
jgi:hypothetical protein